eukprot:COSAG06_NODE_2510_length_6740_cov_25.711683_3_plen_171_part_00
MCDTQHSSLFGIDMSRTLDGYLSRSRRRCASTAVCPMPTHTTQTIAKRDRVRQSRIGGERRPTVLLPLCSTKQQSSRYRTAQASVHGAPSESFRRRRPPGARQRPPPAAQHVYSGGQHRHWALPSTSSSCPTPAAPAALPARARPGSTTRSLAPAGRVRRQPLKTITDHD